MLSPQPIRAARLFGAAEAWWLACGLVRNAPEQPAYEHDVAGVRAQLEGSAFSATWAEGRAMTLDQILAYALEGAAPDSLTGGLDQQPLGLSLGMSDRLTPREREVAHLLAVGRSNREIAEALVITEGTAEVHVKRILNKLGLRSRAQVAARAPSTGRPA